MTTTARDLLGQALRDADDLDPGAFNDISLDDEAVALAVQAIAATPSGARLLALADAGAALHGLRGRWMLDHDNRCLAAPEGDPCTCGLAEAEAAIVALDVAEGWAAKSESVDVEACIECGGPRRDPRHPVMDMRGRHFFAVRAAPILILADDFPEEEIE